MRDNLEAMSHQDTETHAGHVENPLSHNEAHGKEEVGGRNKGEHHQTQSLKKKRKRNNFGKKKKKKKFKVEMVQCCSVNNLSNVIKLSLVVLMCLMFVV